MLFLAIVSVIYSVGVLGRLFYVRVTEMNQVVGREDLRSYVLYPASYLTRKTILTSKDQIRFALADTISLVSASIFFLGLIYLYSEFQEQNIVVIFIHMTVFVTVYIGLLYLAIYDLVHFEIPIDITRKLLFFALVINVVIGLLKLGFTNELADIELGTPLNLIGALFLGGIFWIIVVASKEEAMGAGDIDIHLIIGLLLPWPVAVSYILAMLILASTVSIVYSLIIRKFRGVMVPLVPFMLLGFVFSVSFGHNVLDILFVS